MLSRCHATCDTLCNVWLLSSSLLRMLFVLTWDHGTVAGGGRVTPSSLTTGPGQVRSHQRGIGLHSPSLAPRGTKLDPDKEADCPSECVYSSGHLQLDVLPGSEPSTDHWSPLSLILISHALEKFNESLIVLVTRLTSERYTSLLFKLCQEQINCSKFILSRRAGSHTAAATQSYLSNELCGHKHREAPRA